MCLWTYIYRVSPSNVPHFRSSLGKPIRARGREQVTFTLAFWNSCSPPNSGFAPEHNVPTGSPPLRYMLVRESLNDTFSYRWIGRGGPISWPPRSPDITCLVLSLWGTSRAECVPAVRLTFQCYGPQYIHFHCGHAE